jgi:hypothetical protein
MCAEEVTDLEQARQIIAQLRAQIARMEEVCRPIAGEYSVFLDEEYDRKMHLLFRTRQLYIGQETDSDIELDEAITECVKQAIELTWDMALLDREHVRPWLTTTA